MSYLQDKLAIIDRKIVVQDTVTLIDEEVQRKSGLSGMAIKGGYAAVKKLKSGRMIDKAVEILLDDFTGALSPLYDSYRAQEQHKSFATYLGLHETTATQALLQITDDRIQQAENRLIISTYKKLRTQAERHVTEALPGVGRMIDRHVPHSSESI